MELKEIEDLAVKKYKEAGNLIPVPVVDIAKKLGLDIYEIEMPELEAGRIPSAALDKLDGNNWIIALSQKDHHTRKRFSIAHEIGHFLLHKDLPFIDFFPGGETFYREGVKDEKLENLEKEANYFAANLLMPKEKVKEIWSLSTEPLEIAKKFDVSEVSMTFRLKNLGLLKLDETVKE